MSSGESEKGPIREGGDGRLSLLSVALSTICVFCGCNRGNDPAFSEATVELGGLLARRGIHLVYGGAKAGLMGTLADAVLAAGGEATGVLPRDLVALEPPHKHLTNLHLVDSMHERKQLMTDLSDAFVALPGGLGTLEEVFETISWAQLGIHSKPTGFINVNGFFDPLIDFLDRAVTTGFVRPEHRAIVSVDRRPDVLLDMLDRFEAPVVHKWIDLDDDPSLSPPRR